MAAMKLLPLKPGQKVLNIGSRHGSLSKEMAVKLGARSLVATTASEQMAVYARRHFAAPNLSYRVLDPEHLDYDGTFDRVVSFTTLHWIKDKDAVLKGIHRALRPGGEVILAVPAERDLVLKRAVDHLFARQRWQAFGSSRRIEKEYHMWTLVDAVRQVEGAGLRIQYVAVREWRHRFDRESYIKLLTTVMPYIAYLPVGQRGEFLQELLDELERLGHVAADGSHLFVTKILNVVARKP